MPSSFRTAPRSPVLVRKLCSSQKPYRLSCSANDPASFQSFVMLLILSTTPPDDDLGWFPLHGVVASAEFCGVEEDAQDLYVVFSRDAGDDDADDEEADAAYQRVQHGEDGGACNQRDEEESTFCAQYGQWAVHRLEDLVSTCIAMGTALCHVLPPSCLLLWVLSGPVVSGLRRKKPGHEVHSADRHADAEDNAGEHLLRLALAV